MKRTPEEYIDCGFYEPGDIEDALLQECVFDNCPIATIYAALSGFGHVRDRLQMYEEAGMMPPVTEENH